MLIETNRGMWNRLHATNDTSTSFAAHIETFTQPSGESVIPMGHGESPISTPNGLTMVFFGTTSENDTFLCRVIGWDYSLKSGKKVWNPCVLCQVTATLGTETGITGGEIATSLVADTIALTYGNDDVNISIISPANNVRAHLTLDSVGFPFVQCLFHRNSSAASCNLLYRKI